MAGNSMRRIKAKEIGYYCTHGVSPRQIREHCSHHDCKSYQVWVIRCDSVSPRYSPTIRADLYGRPKFQRHLPTLHTGATSSGID